MNRNGRPMSQRQFDVLFTVAAHGPLSPAEVSRHLLLWPSQSQSALASLLRRKLVDRQYTGLARGERVGYVLTAAGQWIVNLAESEEDGQ